MTTHDPIFLHRERPAQKRSLETQFMELGIDPENKSPLERRLGFAILELITEEDEFGPPGFVNLFIPRDEVPAFDRMPPVSPIPEGVINVCPECHVGLYRPDFLFNVKAPRSRVVAVGAVECDGHDFHERTKEQVSRDRARDREIQAQGVTILRFPGWQVHDHPRICAREAISVLLRRSAAGRS